MDFTELSLHPDLQKGIAEAGYKSCMPVQEQVLSHAFSGHDLYVQSQTGTGKTAAFLIVIFQRLLSEPMLKGKKALIMVPTRELAVQVEEEAKMLGKYLSYKVGSFYGGVGYAHQQKMLRENTDILVGTPGRVLDLNSSGQMNLMELSFLVLDEADRMFDMGFYPDLRKLIKVVPPIDRRQTMLFSATLNSWVKNLAWEYTKEPVEIEIAPETVTVDEVEQIVYHVPSADKMKLLLGILEREKPESAIVFCNTKRYTEIVAKRLRVNGYEVEFIIGDLPQSKRLSIIDDIKSGNIRYLVATDVAARGLDIEGLSLVVNYDLPVETENYVHRIGRTARAGKTGKAFTFASEQDVYELPDIEKYIGKKIDSLIASEELYAQDKSEGMRIHAEVYDDRYDGDRRSGDFRRGDSRRGDKHRDSRQVDGRHGKADRPHDKKRKDEGRRDREGRRHGKEHGKAGRKEYEKTHEHGPPREKHAGLSSLSFEERMAYYKQKYDSPRPDKKAKTEKPAKSEKQAKPGRAAGHDKRQPERDKKKGHSRKDAGHKKDAREARLKTETAPAPIAAKETPRKGLLSRILGIFKK